jgi:predicted DNA-binding transcriptional regulator YafY
MLLASRRPIDRILKIHAAVKAKRWPNATSLAPDLEVTARTIRRDIRFLKYDLRAPIRFDPERNGYFYTNPSYQLPIFELTEGELIALFLAERVLQQYRGAPFAPDLARAFAKITAGLGDRITVDLEHLGSVHSIRTTAPAELDPLIFRDLSNAATARRRVEIDYWTASRGVLTHRQVDPYHLASINGQWYLIGHCHLRHRIVVFLVARIRNLKLTDTGFDVPRDFRVDHYLGQAFSIIRGREGELHRIRLCFRGESVRYIKERVWHPSQTLEETPDGSLIVGLTVSHLLEVERWALSWTPDCEVLEPDELRQRVAAALRQAAIRHSDGHPETCAGEPTAPRSRRSRRGS